MTSISSRNDGTSSRSTCEKTRAISWATLRRKRSACTKSTADKKRDWRKMFGHASGTCTLSSLKPPLSVKSSKAAADSGEKNKVERIVRPIRYRDFHRLHPCLFHRLERRAIDLGGGGFLHPRRKVADAQTPDAGVGVEVEMAGYAGQVARIGTGNGMQYQQRIFDRARHRPQLIQRPAERHRPCARHAPVGRSQPGHPAAHRRTHDAASGFAADRESDQPRRGGSSRPSARSRRAFFKQPRIHRLPAEPDVVRAPARPG